MFARVIMRSLFGRISRRHSGRRILTWTRRVRALDGRVGPELAQATTASRSRSTSARHHLTGGVP